VRTLHGEVVRVLAMPDVRERFAGLGADAHGGTPAEFDAFTRRDIAKWAEVVKASGMKVE